MDIVSIPYPKHSVVSFRTDGEPPMTDGVSISKSFNRFINELSVQSVPVMNAA